MALARKPKPQAIVPEPSVDIDALINKGGSVGTSSAGTGTAAAGSEGQPKAEKAPAPIESPPEIVAVALRLPGEFDARIAKARKGRAVKIPRHTWILEAIMEKLEKDGY
jgi:hypothetical protein